MIHSLNTNQCRSCNVIPFISKSSSFAFGFVFIIILICSRINEADWWNMLPICSVLNTEKKWTFILVLTHFWLSLNWLKYEFSETSEQKMNEIAKVTHHSNQLWIRIQNQQMYNVHTISNFCTILNEVEAGIQCEPSVV